MNSHSARLRPVWFLCKIFASGYFTATEQTEVQELFSAKLPVKVFCLDRHKGLQEQLHVEAS
jgi:hypothetical protein